MSRPNRLGFTLVEMLVVVVIIGLLAAMITPAVVAARARARQAQCAHNQGQVAQGILSYEGSKKHFPGYANRTGGVSRMAGTTSITVAAEASWVVAILQDLNRADLWDQWRAGNVPGTANDVTQIGIDMLVCPADSPPEPGALSFVANCGQADAAGNPSLNIPPDWPANGLFHRRYFPSGGKGGALNKPIVVNVSLGDIKDGTQHTLLLSENVQARQWGDASEIYAGMLWCPHSSHHGHAGHESGINSDFDTESFFSDITQQTSHARPS
ncbi:MAG: DUF1559 domain-containing protein, partial [Pirellulales bacterium]|nr:DUF1559 domain-containing protein [Pirellulales bacterium]